MAKIIPIFPAKIISGKLQMNEDFDFYLKGLNPDAFYFLKIWEKTKLRTDRQHRLYWLYLNILEKEGMGQAEDLHEYFKRVFLQPKIIEIMGKELTIPKSTKDLSRQEFSDYISKIYLETNVPIPSLEQWELI